MKVIIRLLYINYIIMKYALKMNKPYGLRIRQACEDLGPIFIKFGQLLSTRVDLLSDEILNELVKLQDKVPPFDGIQAKRMVEKELGKPIYDLFLEFNTKPLASASIAQVHAAKLPSGTDVVVKILRPNIKKQIKRDLNILLFLAKVIPFLWRVAYKFKLYAIILEINKSMLDELDLVREGSNASQLKRNFIDSNLLYVPKIFWSYTKKSVLTMERIYGIPISNRKALQINNISLQNLAEKSIEIFFTQVFRDCFFHADMHPGNILISNKNHNLKYMVLDFGIVGTLQPDDQYYLAANLLAFFKRNYRKVAELHIESGWISRNIRLNEFESAIRCVCEPIFEKPLKDISFGKTLLHLFQTAYRFDMEIQPQLVLLQKTLINVEGLGRQLYPDLDLWNIAQPFLEKWLKNHMGINFFIKQMQSIGPYWQRIIPDIPVLLYKNLQNMTYKSYDKQKTTIRNPLWYYVYLCTLYSLLAVMILLRILYE